VGGNSTTSNSSSNGSTSISPVSEESSKHDYDVIDDNNCDVIGNEHKTNYSCSSEEPKNLEPPPLPLRYSDVERKDSEIITECGDAEEEDDSSGNPKSAVTVQPWREMLRKANSKININE